jgi:DNA-binding response OmpR family regulator
MNVKKVASKMGSIAPNGTYLDGLQALKHFKKQANIPVIFLTARRRDLDEIVGLELGPDDYITKPFNLDVLLARLKAVFRRMALTSPPASHPEGILSTMDNCAFDRKREHSLFLIRSVLFLHLWILYPFFTKPLIALYK